MGRDLGARTWTEVGSARRELILAVPLGSCEQHGAHLPLDTDTRIAVALADRLARERADVVVAPALAYGASGEHADFAGTLSIGLDGLALVVVELVRSADAFAGVVVVNAHGGNMHALDGRCPRRPHRDVDAPRAGSLGRANGPSRSRGGDAARRPHAGATGRRCGVGGTQRLARRPDGRLS